MRKLLFTMVFAAVAAAPAVANADIILRNRDGRSYEIAVRHSVATTVTQVPAKSFLIVTEGAQHIQLRDRDGKPKGDTITVRDGDRLELKSGKLVKTGSAVAGAEE